MNLRLFLKAKKNWLILAILIAFEGAHAQTINGSLFYDLQKGMPSNISKSVLQDSLGFIWIGTDDALVRFDGHNFLSMLNDEQSPYIKFLALWKSKYENLQRFVRLE